MHQTMRRTLHLDFNSRQFLLAPAAPHPALPRRIPQRRGGGAAARSFVLPISPRDRERRETSTLIPELPNPEFRLSIPSMKSPILRALLAFAALAASSAPAANTDRLVILVSVDGWSHHYFDDPRCFTPAIKKLAAAGARAKRMETSFPTVTWTNHTPLVT